MKIIIKVNTNKPEAPLIKEVNTKTTSKSNMRKNNKTTKKWTENLVFNLLVGVKPHSKGSSLFLFILIKLRKNIDK